MKRSGGLKRRKPMQRKGMKRRKPRSHAGSLYKVKQEVRVVQSKAFKQAARDQRVCAVCRRGNRPWEAHHVITKSFLKGEGFELYHPDNALRLCEYPCHAQHTNAFARIELSCLTDRNIAYAVRLLGAPKAHSHLTRNYAGADPRVDALLRDEVDHD